MPDARIIVGRYTARQLAAVMGVDGKTVTRWIERGWVTGSRLEPSRTESRGGDFYQISERAVRDFILGYTALVVIRKCDKFCLADPPTGTAGAKVAG